MIEICVVFVRTIRVWCLIFVRVCAIVSMSHDPSYRMELLRKQREEKLKQNAFKGLIPFKFNSKLLPRKKSRENKDQKGQGVQGINDKSTTYPVPSNPWRKSTVITATNHQK